MMEMQNTRRSRGMLLFSVSMLILLFSSAGCINTIQKTLGSSLREGPQAGMQDSTVNGTNSHDPVTTEPDKFPAVPVLPKMTPLKSNITQDIDPFLTPDPYPIIHGTRINETPQYDFRYRQPEFTRKYHLDGNATGLLVNVAEGPLYIVFVVTPQQDCLVSPDSCRGSMKSPVTRPFLKITVRDNQTNEIVAEDGYGREFSSDTGNYEFSITNARNADGSITSYTTTPGPRYISVYREGVYHLTIQGNNLDVDLSIITGTSPDPLDATMQSRAGKAVPTPTARQEEEEWE